MGEKKYKKEDILNFIKKAKNVEKKDKIVLNINNNMKIKKENKKNNLPSKNIENEINNNIEMEKKGKDSTNILIGESEDSVVNQKIR